MYFFRVTAIAEAGVGISLMFLPAFPIMLLLGLKQVALETLLVGRIAGAALLAIGVASWLARSDKKSPARFGLLTGILIYNVATALILAYAGIVLSMVGIALWPAVILHSILAVWCLTCIRVA